MVKGDGRNPVDADQIPFHSFTTHVMMVVRKHQLLRAQLSGTEPLPIPIFSQQHVRVSPEARLHSDSSCLVHILDLQGTLVGGTASKMGYSCVACATQFKGVAEHRAHYKSDWHRYNLKRKVAGLVPMPEHIFVAKRDAGKSAPSGPARLCIALASAFARVPAGVLTNRVRVCLPQHSVMHAPTRSRSSMLSAPRARTCGWHSHRIARLHRSHSLCV